MPDETCGLPHYDYPETRCGEPVGRHARDERGVIHAAPLIIDGRECGAVAWSVPRTGDSPEAGPVNGERLVCMWCGEPVPPDRVKWWDGRPNCPDSEGRACFDRAWQRARLVVQPDADGSGR